MESHLFLVLWIPVFETKQIQRFFKSITNPFFIYKENKEIHAKEGQLCSYSYVTKHGNKGGVYREENAR